MVISVRVPEHAFISTMKTECDVLYAVLYICINCFIARGWAVSRRYINVCNSDVFSVKIYLDQLKFCVLMVEAMYVGVNFMLSLMSVMSPPLSCTILLVHIVVKLWEFCFRGELGCLNCNDICMCVVNKKFVFNSVYVDLKYNEISLTFIAGFVCVVM